MSILFSKEIIFFVLFYARKRFFTQNNVQQTIYIQQRCYKRALMSEYEIEKLTLSQEMFSLICTKCLFDTCNGVAQSKLILEEA